jgi:hypothetical protein
MVRLFNLLKEDYDEVVFDYVVDDLEGIEHYDLIKAFIDKNSDELISNFNDGTALDTAADIIRFLEEVVNILVYFNQVSNETPSLEDVFKVIRDEENEDPDEEEFNFDEMNELQQIATTYQFTPEQFNVLKKYGTKSSTNGRELFISPKIYDDLEKNQKDSEFKKEFYKIVEPGKEYLASQIMQAVKKSLSSGNTVRMSNTTYYVLKGTLTKNGNFNFPNPYRKQIKQIKEMKGDELTNTLNMIGGALTKVNNLMDFGVDQAPEIEKGLITVLGILTNIQSELEQEQGREIGPAKDYYLENILKTE